MTLRGVLIGCGFFARNHMQAWAGIEGVEIVGVCDTDPAKAQAFAGFMAGVAFNGAQDVSRGGTSAAAADQLRDLGRRFLPPEVAQQVDQLAGRLADGTLLTPEGLVALERLVAQPPLDTQPQLAALWMGVAGAASTPADLVDAVKKGTLPPAVLRSTAMVTELTTSWMHVPM